MNKEKELIDKLIDLAFAEDIGDGDHTTLSCIPATAMGKSKLLIKEAGVLAGIEVAKEIFNRFDSTMKVEVFINDGTEVKPGDVAMVVEGKVQSLLQTERLMLNVMQRMSGIATMTRKYAKVLEGTNTRVLDTRKTTPGMRILEKMAVKIGGGVNHRIGLFDMILLKDNHVDFAGGIDKAITRAKEYCKEKGKDLKIEIEVRSFDELQQVLDLGGVDRIMFDNFTPEMTKKAVEMVAGKYETESSGGITFDTLREYAECGVDFISVGALRHNLQQRYGCFLQYLQSYHLFPTDNVLYVLPDAYPLPERKIPSLFLFLSLKSSDKTLLELSLPAIYFRVLHRNPSDASPER